MLFNGSLRAQEYVARGDRQLVRRGIVCEVQSGSLVPSSGLTLMQKVLLVIVLGKGRIGGKGSSGLSVLSRGTLSCFGLRVCASHVRFVFFPSYFFVFCPVFTVGWPVISWLLLSMAAPDPLKLAALPRKCAHLPILLLDGAIRRVQRICCPKHCHF